MHTCQCVYACSWAYRSVCLLERKKKRELRHADSSVSCTAVFIIALSVAATDSGSIQRKQAEDEGEGDAVSQRVRFGFFPRSHYPVYQPARGRCFSTHREDSHMPSLVFRCTEYGKRFQYLLALACKGNKVFRDKDDLFHLVSRTMS